MGNCTAKDSTVATNPDVVARRLKRQQSSNDDLRKSVDEYHMRPRQALVYEKHRPAPIFIATPNAHAEELNDSVLVGVVDAAPHSSASSSQRST